MKTIHNQQFMVKMDSVIRYNYALLIIILGALKYGQCENIKCYSCSTKDDDRCLNPENKLSLKHCDTSAMQEMKGYVESIDSTVSQKFEVILPEHSPLPLRCMKLVSTVRGKEYIIRGCQLDSGGHLDICTVVKNETRKLDVVTVRHCSLCDKEGCNFSPNLESFKIMTILVSALFQKVIFF